MTETVKRLNQKKEALLEDRLKLIDKIKMLEQKVQQSQSSPTPIKMEETGVRSHLNANKPTTSGKCVASPAQTVAGKDLTNPLKADTLPKSEEEETPVAETSKTRRRLPKTFTQGSTSRKTTDSEDGEFDKYISRVLGRLSEPKIQNSTVIQINRKIKT
ncbi:hypothetical protein RND71_008202 [Anisodus tanguticus]|uniref:Uncharacterized protein n=1 Tax=Anisodus tanguticus TaxID=243964 RepID=A0AAE1VJR6_9SOLA|nr:hypothetical protein RND71_008202 [Anisodus tanguticus]